MSLETLVIIVSVALFAKFIYTNYPLQETALGKRMVYEVSLAYTCWGQAEWWSDLSSEGVGIVVGALPLDDQNHLARIISETGVGSVLSMVEDFELEEGVLHRPVKPDQWVQLGITTKRVDAKDFRPLEEEQFAEAVRFLEEEIDDKERKVYVHCKAGRGRSVSVVMAYLMKRRGMTYEEAYALIVKKRPQINLNHSQEEAIRSYIKFLSNLGLHS